MRLENVAQRDNDRNAGVFADDLTAALQQVRSNAVVVTENDDVDAARRGQTGVPVSDWADVLWLSDGNKALMSELFQDLGSCAAGCRLDVGQLLDAGVQVAHAIDEGADIVIVNRFGRQEREGKGLCYLVERALSADIPVVIAVPSHRFADWIRFVDGMSVKLRCDRESLYAWWRAVSARSISLVSQDRQTVCEVFK